MRVADGVYILPIPRGSREAEGFLNLILVLDDENGDALVDTGLPGQAEEIASALADVGIGVRDAGRRIFTRQDLDHVGSGAALVRRSGARVLAHAVEAPYIEGELKPLKPTPARPAPPSARKFLRLSSRLARGEHPAYPALMSTPYLDAKSGLRRILPCRQCDPARSMGEGQNPPTPRSEVRDRARLPRRHHQHDRGRPS